MGRAQGAGRQAPGIEGSRLRRRDERVRRRFDRLRRLVRHQAGRPDVHPVGNRKSRHRIGERLPSRVGRDGRHAVGEGRGHAGATPASNLPWSCVSGGSQTTHAHTRAAHAAATDAIKKLQEIAAKTHGGKPEQYTVANERVSGPGRQHDAGAGRAEGDRARRQIRRARAAEGHQRVHEGVGDGAGRPGPDGRGARRVPARRRRRIRSSPASRKSRSMSRPASTTSSTIWPWPTSAR